MKRLFALLMAVCLVALCVTPAMAEEKNLLTMNGPASCAPGSTFTMSFGLVAGTNVAALGVEVSYDTDTFGFVDYENGDLIAGAMAAGNGGEGAGGKVLFQLATTEPIAEAGVLFTVTFKVDSKATGAHDFYFYCSTFNVDDGTAQGKDLEPNAVKQTVTVEGSSVSDVTVLPIYDDAGNVVSAQAGENKTIVTVDGTVVNGAAKKGDGKLSTFAIIGIVVGIALLIVGAVLALLAIGNHKAKKEKIKKETPVPSILDEEAKAFLNMEEDALEKKKDKE